MLPGPQIRGKIVNGLMLRVISALVMLPVAVFIILYGGLVFAIFVTLLGILILYEWNGICEAKPLNMAFILQSITITVLAYFLFHYQGGVLYAAIVLAALWLKSLLMKRFSPKFSLLGLCYAALPVLSLIWISQNYGGWVVLWLMIIVWAMDIGAYFAGKTIGGPKMAPGISPNKTWAGLFGGTVTAMISGLAAAHFSGFDFQALWLLPVAAVLAIWSQIGDLAESALKRHFKVKDSGAIIPGHGGVMDRVDGVVFAAPAMALFLYLTGISF